MKKILNVTFLLTISSFLFAQESDRRIQNDPQAHALLEEINKNYHSKPSLKISFTLLVEAPDEPDSLKSQGVVFLKNDKYKIETDEMTIICDKLKRYVYLKESNELQVNYYEPGEEEIESPSALFDLYKDKYFYKIGTEVKLQDPKLTKIQLIPIDIKNSMYKIIFLYADKAQKEIVKAQIHAKDGVRYTYTINYMEQIPIDDSEFTFDPAKHPGIYIDDMTK